MGQCLKIGKINTENPGQYVRNRRFWPNKYPSWAISQVIHLKKNYTYTPYSAFHMHPVFYSSKIFLHIYEKSFVDYLSQFSIFLKSEIKFWWTGSFSIFLKTNQFYLFKLFVWQRFLQVLFLTQTGKTRRPSDVIYGRLIMTSEFSFGQDVSNWSSGVLKIWS